MENLNKTEKKNPFHEIIEEEKVLKFIDEKTQGPSFPPEVQTPVEKSFYLAKTGLAIIYPTFYYLVNFSENPKEFFKKSYSDQSEIDLNQQDQEGNTFLHYLGSSAYFGAFSDYLIKKGAQTNILNQKKEPALKFNAPKLNGYALSLIENTNKQFLNQVYPDGETILTEFFQKGSSCHLFDIAYALIKQGAHINLRNKAGKTPLDYLNERIKTYEEGTKGYENLKYTIDELKKMGALSSAPEKIGASTIQKSAQKIKEISFEREG